jgi:hypothetical protein
VSAGDDMFQVKAIAADALRGMTVFTASAGASLHSFAQSSGGRTSASCQVFFLTGSLTAGVALPADARYST